MRYRNQILACAIALATALTSASACAEDAAGCQKPPAAQTLDTQWPINIGQLAQQLVVYRCTDYMKDVAAAVDRAQNWIERRSPEVENPAVVFDIDETSLSNWDVIYHDRFAYFADGGCVLSSKVACGWHDWFVSARSTAIAPTLALFRIIQSLHDKNGGKIPVFFITGRRDEPDMRAATETNLRKEGFDSWERLFLRPVDDKGFVSVYKAEARREIEQKYRIIANLGDQYSDLIGEPDNNHAEKCFKIPDPFYFIPPDLPPLGLKCLSR